jgi:hypothetical protein
MTSHDMQRLRNTAHENSRRAGCTAWCGVLLLLGLAQCADSVFAQDLGADPHSPERVLEEQIASPVISTSELAARVDAASAEVLRVLGSVRDFDSTLVGIPDLRRELGIDLDARLVALGPMEVEALSASDAETSLQTLLRMSSQLRQWRVLLQDRVEQLEVERLRLRSEEQFLENAVAGADGNEWPGALVQRVDSVVMQLDAARVVVASRISTLLEELGQISDYELRIASVEETIREIQSASVGSFLTRDEPRRRTTATARAAAWLTR